jgi:hypothetical protein
MTSTLFMAAICAGALAFLIRFLIALHEELFPRAEHGVANRSEWDIEIEHPSPGIARAVPRQRASDNGHSSQDREQQIMEGPHFTWES